MAAMTTIEEGRERRKKKYSCEAVRVVEPYKTQSVRIRFVIPGYGNCKWELSRKDALALARGLQKAVFQREASEIVQRYSRQRKA